MTNFCWGMLEPSLSTSGEGLFAAHSITHSVLGQDYSASVELDQRSFQSRLVFQSLDACRSSMFGIDPASGNPDATVTRHIGAEA